MKGNCYYCGKPGYYKSNCSELKKGKNTEEIRLVNYVNANEQPKFVNSTQITDLVPVLKRSFEDKSDTVFSMKEIEDFKKILDKLQVVEVSQNSLFPLIKTNKVVNHTSKLDLCTEIHIVIFQGECERVEKLSKLRSDNLNHSNKIDCYSNLDFSHLTNYKLLQCALIKTGASKLIILAKNIPTNLLCHKQPSDVLWNTNGSKFTMSHEVELEFKLPKLCSTKEIKHSFVVDETGNKYTYDVIIGRDLLNQLGMDILYSNSHLVQNGIAIPIKLAADVKLKEFNQQALDDMDEIEEIMHMFDNYLHLVIESIAQAIEILDTDYSKTDINNVVEQYSYLSLEEN